MRIIETKNLTKRYRRFEKEPGLRASVRALFHRTYTEKTALNHLDFCVDEGEFVGLIGPNGAGKTTLVKLLTGIIAPSEGELNVLGYRPSKMENEFKRQYAVVMGQKSQLFFDLTAEDTFRLFKEIYGIPDGEYKRTLSEYVELFGVRDQMRVQVRTLSLGERMKMELIAALLHNPRVLFLDEPTIGLDAVAQKRIREFLREVNRARGTTILLTSHYMEDIRALCPRTVVLREGAKAYDGSTGSLIDQYQTHVRLLVSYLNGHIPEVPAGCRLLSAGEGRAVYLSPRGSASESLREMLSDRTLRDVLIEEEEIGDVVERIYRREAAV